MARKAKSPEVTVVESPVNPFAALVQATEPPVAGPVGVAAKASAVIAKLGADTANSVGVALGSVAPSIAAKGVAVGAYPVTVAACSYTLGAKLAGGACPARGVHDVAVVAKIHALGEPTVTAKQLQEAGVPWHSMAAYLKRGWMVQAA